MAKSKEPKPINPMIKSLAGQPPSRDPKMFDRLRKLSLRQRRLLAHQQRKG